MTFCNYITIVANITESFIEMNFIYYAKICGITISNPRACTNWKTSMTDRGFSISTFDQFSALQPPFGHVISTPYRLQRITYLEA